MASLGFDVKGKCPVECQSAMSEVLKALYIIIIDFESLIRYSWIF